MFFKNEIYGYQRNRIYKQLITKIAKFIREYCYFSLFRVKCRRKVFKENKAFARDKTDEFIKGKENQKYINYRKSTIGIYSIMSDTRYIKFFIQKML